MVITILRILLFIYFAIGALVYILSIGFSIKANLLDEVIDEFPEFRYADRKLTRYYLILGALLWVLFAWPVTIDRAVKRHKRIKEKDNDRTDCESD